MFYADPGSGAMLWQLLLAFFFGAAFFFNRFKSWVAMKWSGRRTNRQLDSPAASRPDETFPSITEGQ